MTVLWLLINLWPLDCLNLRGRKTGVSGEKPSKHRRDQLRELSRMKYHTRLGFSVERHNALTACAIRVVEVIFRLENYIIFRNLYYISYISARNLFMSLLSTFNVVYSG